MSAANAMLRVMPTRQCKRNLPVDFGQRAHTIVAIATGQAEPEPAPDEGNNPAAVALGKLSGQKGGKARAAERRAIEKKTAAAR
jgi:hypothetical protein